MHLTFIFLFQAQYDLAAFVLAVNREFAATNPVTHNVASIKIGDEWIVINNEEVFKGRLDVENSFISMAVFKSRSKALTDDFKYDVANLQDWGASLDLYRQSLALPSTATDTSADRKIQLDFISKHLPQLPKIILKKYIMYI